MFSYITYNTYITPRFKILNSKLFKFFSPNKVEPIEVAFVSWPMIRYKREVLFGWVDLLGKVVEFSI